MAKSSVSINGAQQLFVAVMAEAELLPSLPQLPLPLPLLLVLLLSASNPVAVAAVVFVVVIFVVSVVALQSSCCQVNFSHVMLGSWYHSRSSSCSSSALISPL